MAFRGFIHRLDAICDDISKHRCGALLTERAYINSDKSSDSLPRYASKPVSADFDKIGKFQCG